MQEKLSCNVSVLELCDTHDTLVHQLSQILQDKISSAKWIVLHPSRAKGVGKSEVYS